jgi:hypothetical protein
MSGAARAGLRAGVGIGVWLFAFAVAARIVFAVADTLGGWSAVAVGCACIGALVGVPVWLLDPDRGKGSP